MRLMIARSKLAAVTTALFAALLSPSLRAQATSSAVPGASPESGVAHSTGPSVQEAGQRYDRGLKMYAEGDYSLAVIEFERAYELVPDYRVLYNIGQVRIQLANYARARLALEQYLKAGAGRIDPDRKAAVESDLEMLSARTGTLTIGVNVPGAEIFVDDSVVGLSPLSQPLLLDAGEHRLSARKPGFHPRAAQVTLAGRDLLTVQLLLEKVPAQAPRIIVQQRVEESNREAWIWGTWTTAGVFAIVSGVTGGLGIQAASDLDEMRSKPDATRAKLDSASRRARTLLLAADVFGGLAIATSGVALYITLSGSDSGKEQPTNGAGMPVGKRVNFGLRPGWISISATY